MAKQAADAGGRIRFLYPPGAHPAVRLHPAWVDKIVKEIGTPEKSRNGRQDTEGDGFTQLDISGVRGVKAGRVALDARTRLNLPAACTPW